MHEKPKLEGPPTPPPPYQSDETLEEDWNDEGNILNVT